MRQVGARDHIEERSGRGTGWAADKDALGNQCFPGDELAAHKTYSEGKGKGHAEFYPGKLVFCGGADSKQQSETACNDYCCTEVKKFREFQGDPSRVSPAHHVCAGEPAKDHAHGNNG